MGVSVPIDLMASEMTALRTNLEVCRLSHLSNSFIPVGTAQFVHHRIVRGSIDKCVPGRAFDTKNRTDLAWTMTNFLESTLRSPHPGYNMDSMTHLHLVAIHVHQLGNLDSLSGERVENELALPQATLIHVHIRELTKASILELKCQRN